MNDNSSTRERSGLDYPGRILARRYSRELQEIVKDRIATLSAFDSLNSPVLPYLAAWEEGNSELWYEFVGTGIPAALGCTVPETARVFRECLLERRIYRNFEMEEGVRKEKLGRGEVKHRRAGLRQEGKSRGRVEAVYKLLLPECGVVWFKDQAKVESFASDGIHLSTGGLTPVSKEMESEEKCERLIDELKGALASIKTLSGMLPICSHCKKIRDHSGRWNRLEEYLGRHADAQFSHGLCPQCARRLYPELYPTDSEDPPEDDLDRLREEVADIMSFFRDPK
ncbi:MAG: hypothetical protein LJE65_16710 [Desulfobacteraceae bacterium]|jgi:hypothetical protein|nr:hypothetical protein [Desulfobacteraceae bacterium]